MKKLSILLLVIMLITGLVGCGQTQDTEPSDATEISDINYQIGEVQLHPLYEKYPEYFGLDTMKGLEIYVWQMGKNLYHCGVLSGTNRMKTQEEIQMLMGNGATIEEMKDILCAYGINKDSVIIYPVHNPVSSYWYEINDEYQKQVEEMFWGALNNSTVVPKDFTVALTWNCYGVSSYDSKTGKLVKTTDATNPDDYVTYYQLTEEDKEYIYNLITQLDVSLYPEEYNPQNGWSEPSMSLILTVYYNGIQKTIKAEDISLSFISKDEKGQAFLSVCEAICNRLTSTEEWKALPEYEHFYE